MPTAGPVRSARRIIDFIAKQRGREYAEKHAHLTPEQARAVGEL